MAAMYAYIVSLFSGTAEPFWPHLVLILGSVFAGISVGAGIIFESDEYNTSLHRIAKWLVISGVTVESICTVCLFAFDERISDSQQSKIIALESEIAPRRLTIVQNKQLTELFVNFPGKTVHVSSYMQDVEGALFGEQLLRAATDAGLSIDDKRMYISTFGTVTSGIVVTGTNKPLVEATLESLKSFSLASVTDTPLQGNFMNVPEEDAPFPLKIFIGAKPLPAKAP